MDVNRCNRSSHLAEFQANGQVRTNLVRVKNDGSLDPNFYPTAGTDFAVTCLALELYGKILVGGYFNKVNGVVNNYIGRLNDDGTVKILTDNNANIVRRFYRVSVQ